MLETGDGEEEVEEHTSSRNSVSSMSMVTNELASVTLARQATGRPEVVQIESTVPMSRESKAKRVTQTASCDGFKVNLVE